MGSKQLIAMDAGARSASVCLTILSTPIHCTCSRQFLGFCCLVSRLFCAFYDGDNPVSLLR